MTLPFCLQHLGIGVDTYRFFSTDIVVTEEGTLRFPSSASYFGQGYEEYGLHVHKVPVHHGWQHLPESSLVRFVYLFPSAIEALCFLELRGQLLVDRPQSLWVAIGLRPLGKQLLFLRSEYRSAKFILVFPDSPHGRLLDGVSACLLMGRPCTFGVEGDQIKVDYAGKGILYFPVTAFSLNRLEQRTGMRSGIRTLKPSGYATFYDQLRLNRKQLGHA